MVSTGCTSCVTPTLAPPNGYTAGLRFAFHLYVSPDCAAVYVAYCLRTRNLTIPRFLFCARHCLSSRGPHFLLRHLTFAGHTALPAATWTFRTPAHDFSGSLVNSTPRAASGLSTTFRLTLFVAALRSLDFHRAPLRTHTCTLAYYGSFLYTAVHLFSYRTLSLDSLHSLGSSPRVLHTAHLWTVAFYCVYSIFHWTRPLLRFLTAYAFSMSGTAFTALSCYCTGFYFRYCVAGPQTHGSTLWFAAPQDNAHTHLVYIAQPLLSAHRHATAHSMLLHLPVLDCGSSHSGFFLRLCTSSHCGSWFAMVHARYHARSRPRHRRSAARRRGHHGHTATRIPRAAARNLHTTSALLDCTLTLCTMRTRVHRSLRRTPRSLSRTISRSPPLLTYGILHRGLWLPAVTPPLLSAPAAAPAAHAVTPSRMPVGRSSRFTSHACRCAAPRFLRGPQVLNSFVIKTLAHSLLPFARFRFCSLWFTCTGHFRFARGGLAVRATLRRLFFSAWTPHTLFWFS